MSPRGGQRRSAVIGFERLPLWFVEGLAEYLSLGPVDSQTAMWLRDAVASEQAADAEAARQPALLPLPLRPRVLGVRRRALGRRQGDRRSSARACARATRRRRSRRCSSQDEKTFSKEWGDAVRRAYAGFLEAQKRPVRTTGPQLIEQEARRRRAEPRPGALARRQAHRVPLREGPVLDRPLPGRRRHGQGDPQARLDRDGRALRQPAVHRVGRRAGAATAGSSSRARCARARALSSSSSPRPAARCTRPSSRSCRRSTTPPSRPTGEIVFSGWQGGLLDLWEYDLGDEGAEAADERRLRRGAPGGVARRQDGRLHDRPLHDEARQPRLRHLPHRPPRPARPAPSARRPATRRRATSNPQWSPDGTHALLPLGRERRDRRPPRRPRHRRAAAGDAAAHRRHGHHAAQPVAVRRRGLGPHRVHRARGRRALHLRDRRPGEAGRRRHGAGRQGARARQLAVAGPERRPPPTAAPALPPGAANRPPSGVPASRRRPRRLHRRRRRSPPALRRRAPARRCPDEPGQAPGAAPTSTRAIIQGALAPAPARHGPRREQGREDARGPDERACRRPRRPRRPRGSVQVEDDAAVRRPAVDRRRHEPLRHLRRRLDGALLRRHARQPQPQRRRAGLRRASRTSPARSSTRTSRTASTGRLARSTSRTSIPAGTRPATRSANGQQLLAERVPPASGRRTHRCSRSGPTRSTAPTVSSCRRAARRFGFEPGDPDAVLRPVHRGLPGRRQAEARHGLSTRCTSARCRPRSCTTRPSSARRARSSARARGSRRRRRSARSTTRTCSPTCAATSCRCGR